MERLAQEYPWTKSPLIACGPMRLIALAPLAFEVSKAGGLGFVGAGNDASTLEAILDDVKALQQNDPDLSKISDVLPVGVGFLLWAGDKLLAEALPVLEKYRPAAVWLFASNTNHDMIRWTYEIRQATEWKTKIWIQVGTVENAVEVVQTCQPDVLVVQGHDAGGHGLHKAAGLISLLPEVDDAVAAACRDRDIIMPDVLAAGGIMDGRGAAAALSLGASGVVMGTRYLAAPEANVAQGYREAVLAAKDGGQTTERTKLYDQLRGTTDWPAQYGGRGVLNDSYHDAAKGLAFDENKKLHDEALKKGDGGWGDKARLTTYAGAGVGLVKEIKSAAAITEEVREGAKEIMSRIAKRFS